MEIITEESVSNDFHWFWFVM